MTLSSSSVESCLERPGLNGTHAADGAPVQEAHDLRPDAGINKSSMES